MIRLAKGLAGGMLLAVTAGVGADDPDAITAFSTQAEGAVPPPWEITTLQDKSPAEFRIATLDGERVLHATADAAVAALTHPLGVDPTEHPVIEWTWRIGNHIAGSDMRSRAGDDFPARVYVTFARDRKELAFGTRVKLGLARLLYGADVPAAAICYVWDRELPVGTSMPNAYSDTIMMVVAESGGDTPSAWVRERHDYRADYERLFGAPAPPVMAVVVAIDTDDTGEFAEAWFGDLELVRGPVD